MVLSELTIGEMRSTVIFKVNVPTTNATTDRELVTTGGLNDNYGTLLTTRGRLRKKSGNRGLDFGLIANKESYELICRFQSALENNIGVDTKIDIGNFRYTIDTWEKVDEIAHFYKFNLNVEKQFAVNGIPVNDPTYGPSLYGIFKLQKVLPDGVAFITDTDLIPASGLTVTILSLSRETSIYSETAGTPDSTEFKYTPGSGRIDFLNPGNPANPNLEKIEIVYKYA